MVHGFTCAGILPSQYAHLTQFADLGNIGHGYIRQGLFEFLCNTTCTFMVYMYILSSVYQRMGYIEDSEELEDGVMPPEYSDSSDDSDDEF